MSLFTKKLMSVSVPARLIAFISFIKKSYKVQHIKLVHIKLLDDFNCNPPLLVVVIIIIED